MNPSKIIVTWNSMAPRLQSALRIVAALMFALIGTMKLFAFPVGIPNSGTVKLVSELGLAASSRHSAVRSYWSGSSRALLHSSLRGRWLWRTSRGTPRMESGR